MREYKKTTIFDLLDEETYNITYPETTDPMQALFWTAKMGNVRAMIEYLKINDPAHYDPKSKEYKERMQESQPRPFIIDVDGKEYMTVCTKEQLKTYYPKNYLEYFGDDENDR